MIAFLFGCILGFVVGVIIGIKDCKKKFSIPKGEMPYDGNASNADY